jgi:hypothetical protein
MDKQKEVFDSILKLLKEIMINKMYLKTLSIYRDYITDFVEEIEVKLGTEKWNQVRNAIRKKRNSDQLQPSFELEELVFISELEKVLKSVKMSVSEFELLMEMKAMSNSEFHKEGKRGMRKLKEVKSQLEKSLPKDLQVYKVPLIKLLNAHESWKLSK